MAYVLLDLKGVSGAMVLGFYFGRHNQALHDQQHKHMATIHAAHGNEQLKKLVNNGNGRSTPAAYIICYRPNHPSQMPEVIAT